MWYYTYVIVRYYLCEGKYCLLSLYVCSQEISLTLFPCIIDSTQVFELPPTFFVLFFFFTKLMLFLVGISSTYTVYNLCTLKKSRYILFFLSVCLSVCMFKFYFVHRCLTTCTSKLQLFTYQRAT
jgi:hypothetical protein